LHSYLTYLRDRLLLARDLLTPSGSMFVQISDENLHHVRELLDEVFGAENLVSVISFNKNSGLGANLLPSANDFLLWFARDKDQIKYRQLYKSKAAGEDSAGRYNYVMTKDGDIRPATQEERAGNLEEGDRLYI